MHVRAAAECRVVAPPPLVHFGGDHNSSHSMAAVATRPRRHAAAHAAAPAAPPHAPSHSSASRAATRRRRARPALRSSVPRPLPAAVAAAIWLPAIGAGVISRVRACLAVHKRCVAAPRCSSSSPRTRRSTRTAPPPRSNGPPLPLSLPLPRYQHPRYALCEAAGALGTGHAHSGRLRGLARPAPPTPPPRSFCFTYD